MWRDALVWGPLAGAGLVLSHHDNYNWVAPQSGSPAVMRDLATAYAAEVGLRTPTGDAGVSPSNVSWANVPGGFERFCTAIGKPALLIENKAGYAGPCSVNRFGLAPELADVRRHYDALRTLLHDGRLPTSPH